MHVFPMTLGSAADAVSIWLIDISRQMRSAQLDGFDISPEQYPPNEWLPDNISLTILDIHDDIPERLRGKYDIVHVRLFLSVVRKGDPGPVLDRLRSLLSPSRPTFLYSTFSPSTLLAG